MRAYLAGGSVVGGVVLTVTGATILLGPLALVVAGALLLAFGLIGIDVE